MALSLALSRPISISSARSSSLAGTRVHAAARRAPVHGRSLQLNVSANELNKWADRSNYDGDGGEPDDSFDKDTAGVVLRVLTARATQKLLMQMQELDLFVAQWLNNFCSEHPPNTGNKFIQDLMKTPGTVIKDPTTGATHTVDPQNLAHRVLQIRTDLAWAVMKGFGEFVELENTAVMRAHLQAFTYTTSGYEDNHGRRGYHRPRRGGGGRK